ncbi:heavy metal translocating P-type ATPase [Psychrobacter piechaudii]|uniref:Putative copper-exporting P-type ATPase V n=1 Tax=Psychrobacter piechaudii TaxID=1945521 RepID=A0A1R4GU70_9GAMM|nr:heavy metal translocating P-type ATPase [Psychrobacter piechaudii]SJM71613.1 putative copper-exporting P-type ATPase V [Psychrobacter piechaudii]
MTHPKNSSIQPTNSSTSSSSNSAYSDTKSETGVNQQMPINYLAEDIDNLILPPDGCCFHCAEPVPEPPFTAHILGEDRLMCCMGCQLAAESIVEAGLEQYYLDRSEINRTASMPTELERLRAYDHEDIQAQFVYAADGKSVAELSVNNLRCAACTWLIETRLYEMPGVDKCQVNLTNQRMRVIWDEDKLPISDILATINQIGYDAKPYRQDTHEAMLERNNKKMMIRLGIAALGAMQAMMFAVGMYFGNYTSFSGMLVEQRDFLRWVSLFVSIPVFFYCAVPFFTSAWSAIKIRQVNMDVPVSIALIVTFFASLYATISGTGETYYDSVSMFVFFLLAGRYIEHNARLKAANMANDLVVVEPTLVQRLGNELALIQQIDQANITPNQSVEQKIEMAEHALVLTDAEHQKLAQLGELIHAAKRSKQSEQQAALQVQAQGVQKQNVVTGETDLNSQPQKYETVTAHTLNIGDVIMIDAGSEVVADGILCSETATVSQSLLTGESLLIVKHRGDRVIGGSQNDSQPFVMIVTELPENSQIALIDRLMNRALSEKPKVAEQADKWARWFVARILVLAVFVFIAWYFVDPSQALWATVAVLVATCPCALSLATPIALTVSTNRLASYGFLTTRGHTIQTLAEVTHVAFDKTGTLTYGKPNLLYIEPLQSLVESESTEKDSATRMDQEQLLAIAAALEVGSRHPIASALLDAAYQLHLPSVTDLVHHTAGGVEAVVNDIGGGYKYRLGHVDFALNHTDSESVAAKDKLQIQLQKHNASTAVMLTRCRLASEGETAGEVWKAMALYYFNDSVREGVAEMIAALQAENIETVILTGDPSEHAQTVAKELGVDKVYFGLSPSDKVDHIKELQQQGHVVMMVGDGINDAPVLAAANISTAIAGAADLAQVSSDSVILNGKVPAVYDAKRVADKAQHIIKQNLRWALTYNSVVLLPAAFGYVPPWLAAIGMSLSSLVVVLNALRLKRA